MLLKDYLDELNKYNDNYDLERIAKAYNFGEMAHLGQKRKSGQDYFIHPVEVSLILAELNMDEDTIIASLLHDVVEDTNITTADVKSNFGEDVANLVDGVTKLGQIHYETKEERQVENYRKMFLAMAKDIRVILIKLADRLHNIRTLEYMTPKKKREKAKETLEIYAPIAHRLGIAKVKWELEDISLKFLDPEGYEELRALVNKKRHEREQVINGVIEKLAIELDENNIDYDIYGRPKSFYSIYKKMHHQNKTFEEIYDITAIRIIVNSVADCYSVLGIVHAMWKPFPGRVKDYIAMPKSNMYQSLHTTVMGDRGEPFEIQIRTWEMHHVSEYGIAAHWKYKEGVHKGDQMEEKLSWIRQMMEWQGELNDPSEFMKSLKFDLFNNEVFVFTPEGDVINLPAGATPVDFAYKIHSAVGNKCVGAKVNGRIVPLNVKLKNGEIVEILTSKNANGPSRDWLKFVKSTNAKNKIEKGKEMLEKEVRKAGFGPGVLNDDKYMEPILKRLSVKKTEDLYAAIGYGGIQMTQVLPKIREIYKDQHKEEEPEVIDIKRESREEEKRGSKSGVKIQGIDDVLVRYAKCCNPVPGDKIIGYITRGRGITVHRADCPNFEKADDTKKRFIEVQWAEDVNYNYSTEVQIVAPDRKGLLSDITAIISETTMTVTGVNAKIGKNQIAIINLTIEIKDKNQLRQLMTKLKNMPEIIEVKRVTS
jgi:GTP pyrophosphokinase